MLAYRIAARIGVAAAAFAKQTAALAGEEQRLGHKNAPFIAASGSWNIEAKSIAISAAPPNWPEPRLHYAMRSATRGGRQQFHQIGGSQ
jgi:hypothetical protein